MIRLIPAAGALIAALAWAGPASAQRGTRGLEISSDSTFNPGDVTKLAVVVTSEAQGPRADVQTNLMRLVEDEFVQVLLAKGYSIASRSDVQAIVKEQRFQRSGLTEGDAAKIGKMLNVPAVMVVRVTEFSTDSRPGPRPNNPRIKAPATVLVTRASIGARLVGVESGSVLWMGKYTKSGVIAGRTAAPRALSAVSKTIASAFPDRKANGSGSDRRPARKP